MTMDLVMDSRACFGVVANGSEMAFSMAGERGIRFDDSGPSPRGGTGAERMAAAGAIRETRPVQEGAQRQEEMCRDRTSKRNAAAG